MPRNKRASNAVRVSAISLSARRAFASSAKIASKPVPAEGSSTRSVDSQHCRFGGDKAESDRCRELLKVFGFFRAAGLRRQASGKPCQHLEHRHGIAGAGTHGIAVFAQEQDLRCLERFVGVLPQPGAFGVTGAERGLHGGTQAAAVNRAALAQQLR